MMSGAGAVDPVDETFSEYERMVDPKYLDRVRQIQTLLHQMPCPAKRVLNKQLQERERRHLISIAAKADSGHP
jgi:hypothetical protein